MSVKPESLFDVDAVLVSHFHNDHWDQVAIETLPKDLKTAVHFLILNLRRERKTDPEK